MTMDMRRRPRVAFEYAAGASKTDLAATSWPAIHPVVITLVEESLRGSIGLALGENVDTLHAESLAVATRIVTERFAGAIFVSPALLDEYDSRSVERLLRCCPGYSVAAVVRESTPAVGMMLLKLGSLGVRSIVDLTSCEGWNTLRSVAKESVDSISATIGAAASEVLESSTPGTRRFFVEMARLAPSVNTVRSFCRAVGLLHSTLQSRFFRANLPSPKLYISMFRLIHLAMLLEDPTVSLAWASRRLRYSSPQSLSRHLRSVMGVPPGVFRRNFTASSLLAHTLNELFIQRIRQFDNFDPRRE